MRNLKIGMLILVLLGTGSLLLMQQNQVRRPALEKADLRALFAQALSSG